MKINVLEINKIIRSLDVKSTIEGIIASRISEMYSSKTSEYGYSYFFSQYFDSIFIEDLNKSFVPVISKSESIDVKMFFVRSGFIMTTSKAYNHPIFIDMWSCIISLVNNRLDNLFTKDPKNDLLLAMNDFLVDFEVNSNQISDYFINLQKNYEEGVYTEVDVPTVMSNPKKLKTNLSVPELVLLFRSLDDLKPDIFTVESKEELFSFIAANFETKASSSLSAQSVKNNFYKYNEKAKEKWTAHFSTLRAFVFGLKES